MRNAILNQVDMQRGDTMEEIKCEVTGCDRQAGWRLWVNEKPIQVCEDHKEKMHKHIAEKNFTRKIQRLG